MARAQQSNTHLHTNMDSLDVLIPNYALNKLEFDNYKEICNTAGAKIKELMITAGEKEHKSGDWVAKVTVIEKESVDEDRLIAVIKKHGIKGVVKTREYVDMSALETYLYNAEMPKELAADLSGCKDTKTEYRLTVKKMKPKRGAD